MFSWIHSLHLTAQRRMVFWTTTLVFGLGVLTLASMLQPPKSSPTLERQARALAKRKIGAERLPASIAASSTGVMIANPGTPDAVELTLPCRSKITSEKLGERINQARLSGERCPGVTSIASTEVVNVTNGFVATVFAPGLDSFTTDYIHLAPGKNRIVVRHLLLKGGIDEREFIFDRH